jgi:hypothetical protein
VKRSRVDFGRVLPEKTLVGRLDPEIALHLLRELDLDDTIHQPVRAQRGRDQVEKVCARGKDEVDPVEPAGLHVDFDARGGENGDIPEAHECVDLGVEAARDSFGDGDRRLKRRRRVRIFEGVRDGPVDGVPDERGKLVLADAGRALDLRGIQRQVAGGNESNHPALSGRTEGRKKGETLRPRSAERAVVLDLEAHLGRELAVEEDAEDAPPLAGLDSPVGDGARFRTHLVHLDDGRKRELDAARGAVLDFVDHVSAAVENAFLGVEHVVERRVRANFAARRFGNGFRPGE